MKKAITKKLFIWSTIAAVLSACIFIVLIIYGKKISTESASKLGDLYMTEMMFQLQDHFVSIVDIKNKETAHIAEHIAYSQNDDFRQALKLAANSMDFDYLAIYDSDGNYETLLGEDAWYRDLQGFIDSVKAGESTATTGYLTSNGKKYLVFGFPAEYKMQSGNTSEVLLAGFGVDELYEYINLDELQHAGSNAYVEIISTNGSYILKDDAVEQTSYYDRIRMFGHFNGVNSEAGIYAIEKAMSQGESFSAMVSLDGEVKHIHGAPAGVPGDWYFVISMPQGVTDTIINEQNHSITTMYGIAGIVEIGILVCVFVVTLRMSIQQLRETEKAREEAEKARAEAETANKAKSTFLSNMSHDIRTPMNAIVGFTEMLENSIEARDCHRSLEYLEKMRRSSDYLRNLINDVLDMSRIESGMLELSPEPISLETSVDTVVMIINAHISTYDHSFDVNVHDILHDGIYADSTRLKQILMNLLSNAVKFTPKGGKIGLEVSQETSLKGEAYIRTCFVVKDNGIGMSEEFVRNMFESFSREDSKVRKIEGTGLGLTITRNLVDMMGGTIEVNSREDEGSTFRIFVDFKKADITEIQKDISLESVPFAGMRILMAEDNDFNYDIASELLGSNGFVLERAEDGREAVEMYCGAPSDWDMILMDLRMPVLNGYQATEEIRKFEKSQKEEIHIPIIALSADVFAEDVERCQQVGMEGHIAKPIDIKELITTINHFISKENKENLAIFKD